MQSKMEFAESGIMRVDCRPRRILVIEIPDRLHTPEGTTSNLGIWVEFMGVNRAFTGLTYK